MILQIGDDRLFAAVHGRIANAIDALIGHDLERDEILTPDHHWFRMRYSQSATDFGRLRSKTHSIAMPMM